MRKLFKLMKEDKPVYKVLNAKKSCTDTEIIATILGGDENALEAARGIMEKCNGSLYEVSMLKLS